MEGHCFVYILACSDKSFYIGITNNVHQRLKKHQQGTATNYTRIRRPVTLVYLEKYSNRKRAAQRERQLKGWSKKKKINLILKSKQ